MPSHKQNKKSGFFYSVLSSGAKQLRKNVSNNYVERVVRENARRFNDFPTAIRGAQSANTSGSQYPDNDDSLQSNIIQSRPEYVSADVIPEKTENDNASLYKTIGNSKEKSDNKPHPPESQADNKTVRQLDYETGSIKEHLASTKDNRTAVSDIDVESFDDSIKRKTNHAVIPDASISVSHTVTDVENEKVIPRHESSNADNKFSPQKREGRGPVHSDYGIEKKGETTKEVKKSLDIPVLPDNEAGLEKTSIHREKHEVQSIGQKTHLRTNLNPLTDKTQKQAKRQKKADQQALGNKPDTVSEPLPFKLTSKPDKRKKETNSESVFQQPHNNRVNQLALKNMSQELTIKKLELAIQDLKEKFNTLSSQRSVAKEPEKQTKTRLVKEVVVRQSPARQTGSSSAFWDRRFPGNLGIRTCK